MNLGNQSVSNEHPQPIEKEREPSTSSPGAYPQIGSAISIHVKSKGLDYRISRVPASAGHRFQISPGRRVLSATSRVNEFADA